MYCMLTSTLLNSIAIHLLTKPSFDKEILLNYTHASNLSFISKSTKMNYLLEYSNNFTSNSVNKMASQNNTQIKCYLCPLFLPLFFSKSWLCFISCVLCLITNFCSDCPLQKVSVDGAPNSSRKYTLALITVNFINT